MEGNNLQITISAVDEASEVIAAVAADAEESLSELSSSFASSSTAAQESYDSLTEAMSVDSSEISDSALAAGVSFDDAAAQISGAVDDADTSTASSTGSMRSNFIQLGLLAGTVLAPLADLIKNSVSDSQAWNETSAVINQTLKDTGSSIPISEIQDYATQVQGLTLFTQQDVLQSEELILSHKDLQGSYQELTMLSADAATKMGIDLPSATKILTNALSDPAAGMSQLIRQLGIDVPASTVTTIENLAKFGDTAKADQMIMQLLNGQLADLATSAGAAPGAALTQLANNVGTLANDIGNALLPALDDLAKYIEPIVTDLENWVNEHPKLTAGILLTATAIAALVVGIAALGVWVITAVAAFEGLEIAADVVMGIIAAMSLPVTLLVAAIILLGVIIAQNWTQIKEGAEVLGIYWEVFMMKLKDDTTTIWGDIVTIFKDSIDLVISAINMFIGAVDSIKIDIPSVKIGGLSTPALDIGFNIPKIPLLAAGGIVTSTTLAILGESGPEAVVPLSSYSGGLSGVGGAQGGQGSIIININGPISDANTARNYANQIAKSINAQLKLKNFN